MNGKVVLAVVGAGVLIVGLVVGLVPLSAAGVNCGSAFAASGDAFGADLSSTFVGGGPFPGAQAACSSLRSVVRVPAIALLLIGAGLGVGGLITSKPEIIGVTPKRDRT